jgi:hypothetical protein
VIGFCFLMIGYHVGSQEEGIKTSWSLVIAGWTTFGVGVIGYFTMFTIVLVKRHLTKKHQSKAETPTAVVSTKSATIK